MHLRNRVLKNLQNFSEKNGEHLGKIIQSSKFYSEKFC